MTYRPSRARERRTLEDQAGGRDIGNSQSRVAIAAVSKVNAFDRECFGDIASLAALLRLSPDVGERPTT
jgi:hypothetical protein